jgi:hypothetical protein
VCYGFDVAAVSMELVLCCDAEFQGYRFFFSTIRFCAVLFASLQLRSGFDGADCWREWLLAASA